MGTWWAKVSVDLPTNDQFGASVQVSGSLGFTNGTAVRSTRESGEPAHGGNADAVSVWHHWTAPATTEVTFALTNLTGVAFDAALAVYTGSAVGGLTLVTNHHGGAGLSRVVFSAASNTTYRIAVAGLFVHANGAGRLSDWQSSATQFVMTISGVTNRPYVVEAATNGTATNFTGWVPVHTNYVTFNLTNVIATNYPNRFFRAKYE